MDNGNQSGWQYGVENRAKYWFASNNASLDEDAHKIHHQVPFHTFYLFS
jgi:hypothetical protein